MKVALKLGKRHKVVNLTSGACAATTSTTLDCALASPQLGVAVATTKAELAVAQRKKTKTGTRPKFFSDAVRQRDGQQCLVCRCETHGDAAHLIDVGDDVDTEDEWDSKTQNYGLFSRSNTCNGIILCKVC